MQMHYHDLGCGVSTLDIQNWDDFSLKTTGLKGNFIFMNGGRQKWRTLCLFLQIEVVQKNLKLKVVLLIQYSWTRFFFSKISRQFGYDENI